MLWTAAATASHIGIRRAPPWQWAGMPPASPVAVPLFAAIFLMFVRAAAFTLAAAGPLARWLPASPLTAPATAAIAGFSAAAADLAVSVLLASQLASAPAALAPRARRRCHHRQPGPARPRQARRRPPLSDRPRSSQLTAYRHRPPPRHLHLGGTRAASYDANPHQR